MKILMNKTTDGSVDGAKVLTYEVGKEYDLSRTAGERALAKSFVESERAKQVGPDDKEGDEQVTAQRDTEIAPTTVPVNIAPPDQISTSVHPGDIEAVPSRAVKAVPATSPKSGAHAKAAAKPDNK